MKLTLDDAFISVEDDTISIGKNDYSKVDMSRETFATFTKFVNDFATKPHDEMEYDPFEYHKAIAEDEEAKTEISDDRIAF